MARFLCTVLLAIAIAATGSTLRGAGNLNLIAMGDWGGQSDAPFTTLGEIAAA